MKWIVIKKRDIKKELEEKQRGLLIPPNKVHSDKKKYNRKKNQREEDQTE
jgi:hypothetical protein